MITFAVVLVLLSAIALARTIAQDGYSSRPGPRSHHSDTTVRPYYDMHFGV